MSPIATSLLHLALLSTVSVIDTLDLLQGAQI